MAAVLLYRARYIYPDGSVREMVLWKLPKRLPRSEHQFKYRLYYGTEDGRCLIRYDNEHGKGDHRHRGEKESAYRFRDVETLVRDFMKDIESIRGGHGEKAD